MMFLPSPTVLSTRVRREVCGSAITDDTDEIAYGSIVGGPYQRFSEAISGVYNGRQLTWTSEGRSGPRPGPGLTRQPTTHQSPWSYVVGSLRFSTTISLIIVAAGETEG